MIVSSLRDYFIVSVYKFQFVMKIARFASYALAGLSVLFALSCTKNKEEEKPASEASSAKFKVALNLVESNRAEVIVRQLFSCRCGKHLCSCSRKSLSRTISPQLSATSRKRCAVLQALTKELYAGRSLSARRDSLRSERNVSSSTWFIAPKSM